jgi:hypothetical protein
VASVLLCGIDVFVVPASSVLADMCAQSQQGRRALSCRGSSASVGLETVFT